jgi:Protein of unknown function (DUF1360)
VPVDAERPPYRAYALLVGTFLSGLGGTAALARALDRDPRSHDALDLVVLGLATFKAGRTIARDEVTSFVRAPFVEGEAHTGEGEEPVQTGGMSQALGELVTCTRCAGTWAAAGLVWTQVLAPRFGRLLTWSLSAGAINDFLQAGFAIATHKANELEQRAS